MGLLIGHVAGFPVEEVLMSLSGLSVGLITASVIRRIPLLRKTLWRRDRSERARFDA